tara:strand:- start:59 stop:730 length:672 start_codon:yes stop_codon:yes gene_type:complete
MKTRKDGCFSGGENMKPEDYKGDVALDVEELKKLKTKNGYWRKPVKKGTSRDTSVSKAMKLKRWSELEGIDETTSLYRQTLRSISPSYWTIGLMSTTRTRARLRGMEHNLDRQYLMELMGYERFDYWDPEKEICPALKIPYDFMSRGKGGRYNSKSIDRKDPTKGYIKDNIRFISRQANSMIVNSTVEQQLQVAVWRLKNDAHTITDMPLVKELVEEATSLIY